MGQSHEHRVFDLTAGVDLAGLAADELLEGLHIVTVFLDRGELLRVEADTKPPLCPATGAPQAEVGVEELRSLGKIDPVDRLLSPLLQEFGDAVAADPLQITVVDGELPPRVGERGERRPVPLILVLAGGEVFLDRLEDLCLRLPHRLIHRPSLRLLRRHAAEVVAVEFAGELARGPTGVGLRTVVAVEERADVLLDLPIDHVEDDLTAGLAVQNPLTEAVDPLPLLVHHLVIFEQVLADLEVPLLDLLLCGLDPAGHHPALDRLAILHAESGEHVLHPFAGEDPHQIVFEREEKPARAGVALATAAAAELKIDAAGLVPFGAHDLQAAHVADDRALFLHFVVGRDFGDERVPLLLRHVEPRRVGVLELRPGERVGVAAENDVGAAARHVGGDRDGAESPRLRDDLGLTLVLLGVEHLMVHAPLLEQIGEPFALLDGDGADQHGQALVLDLLHLGDRDHLGRPLAFRLELVLSVGCLEDRADLPRAVGHGQRVPAVDPLHLVGHGDPLLPLGAVDDVGMVEPLHAAVGRDGDHVELVDLPELVRLGHGGAGHAAHLLVELEEVLQRDGGEGLRLLLHLHSFLRLDRLVQAVGPLPPRHEAAGELVNDHHLAVLHDVVDVALVEMVGLERVVDEVGPLHVARGVEALHAGEFLGSPHALLGEGHGVFLLLDLEVAVGHQLPSDLIGLGVFRDVVVGGAGDDQRRAGLVDEDVVHLVDDREGERPLALLHVLGEAVVAAGGHSHVVAEIVEAEFVVGAVGDVAGIRLLPLA